MSLTLVPPRVPLQVDPDGVVRVAETRVTLDTIVLSFGEGASPEEMAQQYPSLRLSDIYAVLGYYLQHQEEVHDYLKERQRQHDETRQINESRFDPQGLRERLLTRKNRQRP
ncbi:MAG: DUF433 domain-containing protein [Acidobacteria bacterium]|nr:DUF433 domain-containing protein [Acidobacteriota bacterium]MCI0720015.1 DUF433 domain-containing protein [Acidobacteriota bacterium]